jgi:hypothetical protein
MPKNEKGPSLRPRTALRELNDRSKPTRGPGERAASEVGSTRRRRLPEAEPGPAARLAFGSGTDAR